MWMLFLKWSGWPAKGQGVCCLRLVLSITLPSVVRRPSSVLSQPPCRPSIISQTPPHLHIFTNRNPHCSISYTPVIPPHSLNSTLRLSSFISRPLLDIATKLMTDI